VTTLLNATKTAVLTAHPMASSSRRAYAHARLIDRPIWGRKEVRGERRMFVRRRVGSRLTGEEGEEEEEGRGWGWEKGEGEEGDGEKRER
jgi:hypothetical protein